MKIVTTHKTRQPWCCCLWARFLSKWWILHFLPEKIFECLTSCGGGCDGWRSQEKSFLSSFPWMCSFYWKLHIYSMYFVDNRRKQEPALGFAHHANGLFHISTLKICVETIAWLSSYHFDLKTHFRETDSVGVCVSDNKTMNNVDWCSCLCVYQRDLITRHLYTLMFLCNRVEIHWRRVLYRRFIINFIQNFEASMRMMNENCGRRLCIDLIWRCPFFGLWKYRFFLLIPVREIISKSIISISMNFFLLQE